MIQTLYLHTGSYLRKARAKVNANIVTIVRLTIVLVIFHLSIALKLQSCNFPLCAHGYLPSPVYIHIPYGWLF